MYFDRFREFGDFVAQPIETAHGRGLRVFGHLCHRSLIHSFVGVNHGNNGKSQFS